jgi:hypothetical protein
LFACTGIAERLAPPGPLDLRAPVHRATGRQIAGLGQDLAQCRALLEAAGAPSRAAPAVTAGAQGQCGYANAVVLRQSPSRIAYAPAGPTVACPVAAALLVWEREVVQPAANVHFGSRVASIDHFGTYACRNVYNSAEGNLSEHARANAIDVAGFRLANGRRVSVRTGWNGREDEQAFLREVRDGACRLFATTLSPDYNAAHADHFHLDQAQRGFFGFGYCR